tara:strand:- start:934 stop:1569 length:636 start_codon:yes stop_codon:yes gene_type:complete
MKNESSDNVSDKKTEPDPVTQTGPRINQNLVVSLILGGIVIVLSLLALQVTDAGFGDEKSEVEKLREELNAKRQSMGLVDGATGPSVESPAQLATRLSTESSQLAALVSQLQASVESLGRELRISQTTVRSLSSQLASATNATIDTDDLRGQLTDALSRATAAEKRLLQLQKQSAGAPTQDQLEILLAERDQLRSMVAQLKKTDEAPESTE